MTTLSSPIEGAGGARSRARMQDVAALAGVSLKTVSRVVNHEPGVSEELTLRVTRAAEQLDYRPNLTASNLRRSDRRTGTVGLLVEDVANEFFASIHRGVEEVARRRGAAVVAASLDRDTGLERDLVSALASRRVDGLILAPTSTSQAYLNNEIRSGWPIVFVDRQPNGVDVDVVVTDNRESSEMGVAHLLAHGHRRIAFIGGRASLTTEQQRFAGYSQALSAAALPLNPEYVHHGAQGIEDAQEIARAMLSLPEPPSAFFTAQNLITMGTVRALRERGLQDTVGLVGFDDFMLADLLEPAVTVIAQDPRSIGVLAAEILFRRMDNSHEPTASHVVPSRLVIRGTGEIRQG